METPVGPFGRERIVLCSADAGPGSQRDYQCEAGFFFPEGKWVGAVRNCSDRLGCDFVILTTAHGMVRPWETIEPYDMHVNEFREKVREIWEKTIPKTLGNNRYDIMVFYAGGCPREPMIELLLPLLQENDISLITFGRPNMFDIDKTDEFVEALVSGTTFEELESILKKPERLEYYPTGKKKGGVKSTFDS